MLSNGKVEWEVGKYLQQISVSLGSLCEEQNLTRVITRFSVFIVALFFGVFHRFGWCSSTLLVITVVLVAIVA